MRLCSTSNDLVRAFCRPVRLCTAQMGPELRLCSARDHVLQGIVCLKGIACLKAIVCLQLRISGESPLSLNASHASDQDITAWLFPTCDYPDTNLKTARPQRIRNQNLKTSSITHLRQITPDHNPNLQDKMCIGYLVNGKCGHPMRREVQPCQDHYQGLPCVVLEESPETLRSNCWGCFLGEAIFNVFCFCVMMMCLWAVSESAVYDHCIRLSPVTNRWVDVLPSCTPRSQFG